MNQIIKEKCTSWPADGDVPVLHSRVHRVPGVRVYDKQSCCTDRGYQLSAGSPVLFNVSCTNPTLLRRRNVEYYYYYLLYHTTGHAAAFGYNQQNMKSKRYTYYFCSSVLTIEFITLFDRLDRRLFFNTYTLRYRHADNT